MTSFFSSERFNRYFLLGLYILVAICLLVVPLRISGHGYIPADDAMRHCAFAVDSRTWGDVLIIRPEIHNNVDSHPGWHSLLRGLHAQLGLEVEDLVVFSYIFTFVVFGLAGLLSSRAPLAWLVTLALATIFLPELTFRLLLGRPFAISAAALVIILFFWTRNRTPSWPQALLFNALPLAFAIWLHPSWYLWLLVVGGLFFSRGWRGALQFAVSLALGLVGAAIMARDSYSVIIYPVEHFILSLAQDPIVRTSLVGEFQPNLGAQAAAYLALFIFIIGRSLVKRDTEKVFEPDLVVACMGWILGLYVTRFWLDWGAPALAVWIARQLASFIEKVPDLKPKFMIAVSSMAVMCLGMTSDFAGRYSSALKEVVLTMPKEKLQGFMPQDGGVLYTTDMHFFYATYYRLPHQHFRYVIGFEPGMMRAEDLEILRRIQFNDSIEETYEPWVKRMTEKDRIMIRAGSEPKSKGIKYEAIYGGYWIGHLEPKKPEKSEKSPNVAVKDKEVAPAAGNTPPVDEKKPLSVTEPKPSE